MTAETRALAVDFAKRLTAEAERLRNNDPQFQIRSALLAALDAGAAAVLAQAETTPAIQALERGIVAISRLQSDEDDEGTEILICDYCYEGGVLHKDHCPIAILQRLIDDYRVPQERS